MNPVLLVEGPLVSHFFNSVQDLNKWAFYSWGQINVCIGDVIHFQGIAFFLFI